MPVLLPLAFILWNGFTGVDFGSHWDEPFMLRSVTSSLARQVWLPTFYNYPSGAYWVSVAGTLPEIINAIGMQDRATYFNQLAENPDYLLRLRRIFIVMTALTTVWLYAGAYLLSKNRLTALLAASLFAASWEINYHARWVAPDNLVWMTATLTMLFAIVAVTRPHERHWLWLTAVAAGLAIGSKYSVGLVVIYVVTAAYFAWRETLPSSDEKVTPPLGVGLTVRAFSIMKLKNLVILLFIAGIITSVTYLLTTPGTLLDSQAFMRDLQYEITHYRTGHENHTVSAGLVHLRLNLTYLSQVVFSPYGGVALVFAMLSLVGIFALWRRSVKLSVIILAFPVVYLGYISTQQVMIVRNLIVIFPTMCLLAAFGVNVISRQMRSRPLQYAFAGGIVGLIALSALWNINATRSIDDRQNLRRFIAEAQVYMSNHPDDTFCISGPVRYWMADIYGLTIPENARISGENADYWVFLVSDVGFATLEANHVDLTVTWFGPYEINYAYYPSWWGDDRVIVMDADKAAAYNAQVANCM